MTIKPHQQFRLGRKRFDMIILYRFWLDKQILLNLLPLSRGAVIGDLLDNFRVRFYNWGFDSFGLDHEGANVRIQLLQFLVEWGSVRIIVSIAAFT